MPVKPGETERNGEVRVENRDPEKPNRVACVRTMRIGRLSSRLVLSLKMCSARVMLRWSSLLFSMFLLILGMSNRGIRSCLDKKITPETWLLEQLLTQPIGQGTNTIMRIYFWQPTHNTSASHARSHIHI